MKKTIILAALLALTTSSWAVNPYDTSKVENYGKSLADRVYQGQFTIEEAKKIMETALEKLTSNILDRNYYKHYAEKAFNERLSELHRGKDAGAKDTGTKDAQIENWFRDHGVSDTQLTPKPIEGFTGEPKEVIEITEGSPWVANYPSGTYLFNKFQVKNRKGAVESSEVFNIENPQNRESKKQQFIQKLERAGWQRVGEDRLKWNGP